MSAWYIFSCDCYNSIFQLLPSLLWLPLPFLCPLAAQVQPVPHAKEKFLALTTISSQWTSSWSWKRVEPYWRLEHMKVQHAILFWGHSVCSAAVCLLRKILHFHFCALLEVTWNQILAGIQLWKEKCVWLAQQFWGSFVGTRWVFGPSVNPHVA